MLERGSSQVGPEVNKLFVCREAAKTTMMIMMMMRMTMMMMTMMMG